MKSYQWFVMIALFAWFTVPASLIFASDEWTCVKEKNGIGVFSKKVMKSKYNQTKSVTVINAPFESIIDTLRDFKSYPRWQPFMEQIKILENNGNDQVIAHASFDFPWPISNRELVVKNTILHNEKTPSTLKVIVEGIDCPVAKLKKNIYASNLIGVKRLLKPSEKSARVLPS